MPIVLHQGYYDNFSPDMNNIKYSKQYVSNIMKSNSQLTNTNEYLNLLRSNTFNQPIDAKTLQDLVNNIKSIYKNNIDLMIKLKNNFSTTIGGMPPVPPLGIIPPPAPGPPTPSSTTSTSSSSMTPTVSSTMPPFMPIPPPAAAAPAGPVFGPAPAPAPASHPLSGIGTYLGLWGRPAGAGRGKKGGRVKIIEQYGVGTKIMTIIDTIDNNVNNIKLDMVKLLAYKQYISPANINDIVKLHEQFFNYFNENIVPYLPTHVIPPITSLIGVDYGEIIDKLNELYINYYNSFNRFIIPKLTGSG
jgi:hypothetical protein